MHLHMNVLLPVRESVLLILVLNSVTSPPQWILTDQVRVTVAQISAVAVAAHTHTRDKRTSKKNDASHSHRRYTCMLPTTKRSTNKLNSTIHARVDDDVFYLFLQKPKIEMYDNVW